MESQHLVRRSDLQRLRWERGLRQADVAQKVGCSIALISLLERQLYQAHSRSQWSEKIVDALMNWKQPSE